MPGSVGKRLRKLLRRQRVDDWLDWVRFWVDTSPRMRGFRHLAPTLYQPTPILGITDAARSRGSESRWAAMLTAIEASAISEGTATDIGANTGYFSLELAELGFSVLAVEPDPPLYRTAIYASRKAKLYEQVAVAVMTVTPKTVDLLPTTDVVVFFSLWHHFVRSYGVARATWLLEQIWLKTRHLLFFETGESEMPESFGLPAMEPDSRAWLERFLVDHCPGGTVEHLGVHQAFDADRREATRNLFLIRRD